MVEYMFHCRDCEWSSAIASEPDRSAFTKQAISHHIETGHEVTVTEHQGETAAVENEPGQAQETAQSSAHPSD